MKKTIGSMALFALISLICSISPGSAGSFTLQQELYACCEGVVSEFGWAVSICADESTALVGYQGAAYIFKKSGTTWVKQEWLLAGDMNLIEAANSFFGYSVALSKDGQTALIGAYGFGGGQGAAYVFVRSGNNWTKQQKIMASDGAPQDLFGISVALSADGNIAIVGATGADVGGKPDQGAAYVFTRIGTTWTQQSKLMASDGAANDLFGTVALSGHGDTAIVGAPMADVGGKTDQGAAYVFTRSGATWSQQKKLIASDGATNDQFGGNFAHHSVALSYDGNTALVGAAWADVGGKTNQGAAYVFTRSGTTWAQQSKLVASDGAANDEFGTVTLSGDGNTAIVGAPMADVGGKANQGSAYVFTRSGTVWTQQSKLTSASACGVMGGAGFGAAVELSTAGYTAVVGAPSGVDDGTAYVFGTGVYAEWTSMIPPGNVTGEISDIQFTSATEGWAIGGYLFHYSGGTWTLVPSVYGRALHFTSPNDGWVMGPRTDPSYKGVFYHYSGGTWTSVTPPVLSPFWGINSVHFTSASEGWAVGDTNIEGDNKNYKGLLLHYSGGVWTNVPPPSIDGIWSLAGVHFTSPSEGWAVGCHWKQVSPNGELIKDYGVLLHCVGGTWNVVQPPSLAGTNWWLSGVYLTSPSDGWAVGTDEYNKKGVLLHYDGLRWSSLWGPQPNGTPEPPSPGPDWWLRSVHFTSPNEGWAAGGVYRENFPGGSATFGLLLHYSGGAWTPACDPVVMNESDYLTAVHFTSANEGWAGGFNLGEYSPIPVLLHYTSASTRYNLTVNISPPGGGSVSLNPAGGSYPPGTQVTLTAFWGLAYAFLSWSGVDSSNGTTATVTMNSDRTVTANFRSLIGISPTSRNHGPGAETGSFNVTVPPGYSWTVFAETPWVTITSNSKGTGDGTVYYSISANPGPGSRAGQIVVEGDGADTQYFKITQNAPSSSCISSIAPTSRNHGSGAETGSVSVTALSGCNWTAAANVNWITITSGSSGTGNGTVYYSVSANPGPGSRTGTLTIGGQTFTVIQGGVSSGWTPVNLPSVSSDWSLLRMQATSLNEGWAVGQDNANGKGVLLYHSGGSWNSMTTPSVSSDWDLQGIHFTSANEGWAVGSDTANRIAALLHYSGGSWASVPPPYLSSHWYLCAIHFTSQNEGWAVGGDTANTRGSLLHYSNSTWTAVTPPSVSSNWYLREVYFTSPSEGWAVGADKTYGKGVLLHYSGGGWTSVNPPSVSSDWWLLGLHFISPSEGWAVGHDEITGTGVLLHYSGGAWTSVSPPFLSSHWWARGVYLTSANEGWAVGGESTNNSGVMLRYSGGAWSLESLPSVSSDWEIWGIHAASPNEAWAVGIDDTNKKGVLLHLSTAPVETVSTPTKPTGTGSGSAGSSYSYSTGGSTSSVGHSVEYQFDWKGDGSDLSVWGASTQSKAWSQAGTYSVKARARCATDTLVMSDWSQGLLVTISTAPVETVSTPSKPTGTGSGTPGSSYSYSTGGSTSSLGHSVEYQFDWKGDGSDLSVWEASTQSKKWPAAGSYSVRARARCKTDTSIVSGWSNALTVSIAAAPAPDLTGQWVSLAQTCRSTRSGQKCQVKGSFIVQNIGNQDASVTFYVRFYLSSDNSYSADDTFLKQVSVSKLKKGTSKKINSSINLSAGVTATGKFGIAVVDPQSVVPELNRNNNQIANGPIP